MVVGPVAPPVTRHPGAHDDDDDDGGGVNDDGDGGGDDDECDPDCEYGGHGDGQ